MLSGAAVVKTLVEGKELTVGSVVWIRAVVDMATPEDVLVRVMTETRRNGKRARAWKDIIVAPAECFVEPSQ